MLSNTLNTNEVKDSAGVEVEYQRLWTEGRTTVFAKIGESPNLEDRFAIKHAESGVGIKRRRRSVVRFDKTSLSTVDATLPVTTSAQLTIDSPIGAVTTDAELTNTLARLISFIASTGATTTILYNGTGNGAVALREGSL